MEKKLTVLVAASAMLITTAVSACGGGGATSAAPQPGAPAASGTGAGDAMAGKAVFDQNCNSCHPGGQQGVGPALAGRNLPASRIQSQVRNGGGKMPAFSASQISDQQLSNLVAYVQAPK